MLSIVTRFVGLFFSPELFIVVGMSPIFLPRECAGMFERGALSIAGNNAAFGDETGGFRCY